jgi:drug/metabolite transporter (DMT)-like permease
MAFVFGWAWLNERIDGLQALGGLLVIAGIVLAQTSRVRKQEKEEQSVDH